MGDRKIQDAMRGYIRKVSKNLEKFCSKKDTEFTGKKIYIFGDSILDGHTYEKSSADFLAEKQGMVLKKFARNGASVLDLHYMGGQILEQVLTAPEAAPDLILFDGGTNDAEYLKMHPEETTYVDELERLIRTMKEKWPESSMIYLIPHRMGSRDAQIQEKIIGEAREICRKWKITVADIFQEKHLNTENTAHQIMYTFDENNEDGLPSFDGSGTHPNLLAIEEFYLPVLTEALHRAAGRSAK